MKKTKITLSLLAMLPVLFLNSCQNESEDLIQDTNYQQESFLNNSPSEEELLQQGWKIVKIIKLDPATYMPKDIDQNKTNVPEPEEKLIDLTQSHLRDLGYDLAFPDSKNKLKSAFSRDGQTADGVWFNAGLNVDGHTGNSAGTPPNVKIKMGTPQVSNNEASNMPDDVFVNIAENKANTEGELSVKYSYKEGYKTSWQRKVSGSLKIGTKASIKFPLLSAEMSAEVTVGGETTDGTEKSHEILKEAVYKAKVPARSKVEIKAFTKVKQTTVNYTIPYELTGNVRVNYPTPANQHYFWSGDINSFPNFKPNLKSEMGSAQAITYVEVHVVASPAQKL